jgi:hypothetical protein
LEVDSEKSETLLRFFGAETNPWYNTAIKIPSEPFIRPKLIVADDALIAKLKKKNQKQLGFSITYLPMAIQEHTNDRPRLPHMALLLVIKKGEPVGRAMDAEAGLTGEAILGIEIRIDSDFSSVSNFLMDLINRLEPRQTEDLYEWK